MKSKYSSMTNLQGAIMATADVKKNPLTNMQGIQRTMATQNRSSTTSRNSMWASKSFTAQEIMQNIYGRIDPETLKGFEERFNPARDLDAARSLSREEYLLALKKEEKRRYEEMKQRWRPGHEIKPMRSDPEKRSMVRDELLLNL